ncbi:hypothetical protein [uncultured Akkermansia sp.]|uniref:hypothetical protein n=1 Tax=uncultured Akkermansia sp. TaxID=512294 RepID=UPI0025955527|nr:hypothetical protein [uncultured Akkermansia sp.]
MDEEAAALQKEREEATKPPFLALGTQGAQFVYYARRSEILFHWRTKDHTPVNMRFLAPVEWWQKTLDPDGQLTPRQVMDRAIDYCIDLTGSRKFDPDAIRKCGVWDEDGAAVYHAGNAVYLFCPGNGQERPFQPVDHARTGKPLYLPGKPLLAPSDDMLTDEEGKTIAEFIGAHSWKRGEDAFLCLGLVTQAILSGYLRFRAHGWINAPSGSGKTTLRESVQLLIGDMARYFKGLETTDAGLRQKLESDSCPVIFDEADSDNAAKTANMGRILALLRTATDGDVGITKGGVDGKSVTYLMRNAFLLFSVRSMIEKSSEQSRIFELELEKKDPSETAPLFQRHNELAAVIREGDLGRKYITRIIHHAPDIRRNIEALRQYLSGRGEEGRRAEMFATVYASAHFVTSGHDLTPQDMQECADMAAGSDYARVLDDDGERCLEWMLGYSPPIAGNRTIREFIKEAAAAEISEDASVLERYGLYVRKTADGNKCAFLNASKKNRKISEIFKGSEWEGVNVKKVLLNVKGLEEQLFRLNTRVDHKVRGIRIPLYSIIH